MPFQYLTVNLPISSLGKKEAKGKPRLSELGSAGPDADAEPQMSEQVGALTSALILPPAGHLLPPLLFRAASLNVVNVSIENKY